MRERKNISITRDPRLDPQRGDEARCGGLIRRVIRREGDLLWCQSGGMPYRFKLQLWQKWQYSAGLDKKNESLIR
jgi:hypothetical protein